MQIRQAQTSILASILRVLFALALFCEVTRKMDAYSLELLYELVRNAYPYQVN